MAKPRIDPDEPHRPGGGRARAARPPRRLPAAPRRARRAPERGAGVSFGKRIGDGTTEAISRLTDVGAGRSLEVSDERVARALAKLEEGSYGTCDRCGQAIAPARLRAAPESVLCIDCARGRG